MTNSALLKKKTKNYEVEHFVYDDGAEKPVGYFLTLLCQSSTALKEGLTLLTLIYHETATSDAS